MGTVLNMLTKSEVGCVAFLQQLAFLCKRWVGDIFARKYSWKILITGLKIRINLSLRIVHKARVCDTFLFQPTLPAILLHCPKKKNSLFKNILWKKKRNSVQQHRELNDDAAVGDEARQGEVLVGEAQPHTHGVVFGGGALPVQGCKQGIYPSNKWATKEKCLFKHFLHQRNMPLNWLNRNTTSSIFSIK